MLHLYFPDELFYPDPSLPGVLQYDQQVEIRTLAVLAPGK
jgi:hypothetical protein